MNPEKIEIFIKVAITIMISTQAGLIVLWTVVSKADTGTKTRFFEFTIGLVVRFIAVAIVMLIVQKAILPTSKGLGGMLLTYGVLYIIIQLFSGDEHWLGSFSLMTVAVSLIHWNESVDNRQYLAFFLCVAILHFTGKWFPVSFHFN